MLDGEHAADEQARALSLRLFAAGLAAAELMTAYLGLRLGLYAELAHGPATAAQLAERASIAPRYSREWLEQQAACGILTVDDPNRAAERRVYSLPAGHALALTDTESPFSIAPLVLMPIGGMSGVLPRLLELFRSGEGLPYGEYGADMRDGRAGLNKYAYLHQLPRWIADHVPDIHTGLSTRAQRIADVACGNGWSSIALARAYPHAIIHGFDLDEASILDARSNASDSGLTEQISFYQRDAGGPLRSERYNLVCIFDALHDMARPVQVLSACRTMLEQQGSLLMLEPNVSERFTAPANDTERFHYAVSVLHCLPVGMTDKPSAETGTVMRPSTVRHYAREAGFARVAVIDIGHPFYRLYRLYPGTLHTAV